MLDECVQAKCVDLLRDSLPDLTAVYLFGSFATKQATKDSDIDLAILSPKPLSASSLWNLAQQLALMVGRDVDLIDLRVASTVLRLQVVVHGYPLACFDEKQREIFEDFVYSDYARLNEERSAILRDISQRGSVYG